MITRLRCDLTPAWAALTARYAAVGKSFDLRDAFAEDPQRFGTFSQETPHIFADLSKNLIDRPTEALLVQLAEQCGLEAYRDAMFAGASINSTEQRAVMHFLLRNPPLAYKNNANDATNTIAKKSREVQQVLTSCEDRHRRV